MKRTVVAVLALGLIAPWMRMSASPQAPAPAPQALDAPSASAQDGARRNPDMAEEIAWPGTLEDPADIVAHLAIDVPEVRAIAHQPAPGCVNVRQPQGERTRSLRFCRAALRASSTFVKSGFSAGSFLPL